MPLPQIDVDSFHLLFFFLAGSEVQICVDVAKAMGAAGVRVRVVSMPCWELFEAQSMAYQLEGELQMDH